MKNDYLELISSFLGEWKRLTALHMTLARLGAGSRGRGRDLGPFGFKYRACNKNTWLKNMRPADRSKDRTMVEHDETISRAEEGDLGFLATKPSCSERMLLGTICGGIQSKLSRHNEVQVNHNADY